MRKAIFSDDIAIIEQMITQDGIDVNADIDVSIIIITVIIIYYVLVVNY